VGFSAFERRFVAQTPRVPIAPPMPRAFDRAEALRTFDRVTKRVYVSPDWADAEIPPAVSREEATFWLYAISGIDAARVELLRLRGAPQRAVSVDHDEARAHARAELERLDVAQPPSRASITRRLAAAAGPTWGGGSYREIAIALAALLDAPSLLETILDEANDDIAAAVAVRAERAFAARRSGADPSRIVAGTPPDEPAPGTPFAVLAGWAQPDEFGSSRAVMERAWLNHSLAAGFANYVAPYLDGASFEQARAVVRPAIGRALARPPFTVENQLRTEAFPAACYLAASLHLTDEIEAIVAWWADDLPTAKMLSFLPAIVYGLRTPEAVVAESRRLGIALPDPPAVREWLATTGEAGVDYACEQLADHAAESTADAFVATMTALDVASLPGTVLRLTAIPLLYVSARSWLEANFDRALAALASANHGASALGATANEILRRFARRGHRGAAAALDAKAHTV
jgi:hypothetical protein